MSNDDIIAKIDHSNFNISLYNFQLQPFKKRICIKKIIYAIIFETTFLPAFSSLMEAVSAARRIWLPLSVLALIYFIADRLPVGASVASTCLRVLINQVAKRTLNPAWIGGWHFQFIYFFYLIPIIFIFYLVNKQMLQSFQASNWLYLCSFDARLLTSISSCYWLCEQMF